MSEYSIQDTTLTGIANAIRSKTGDSSLILVSDMAQEISSIPAGSELQAGDNFNIAISYET